MGTLPHLERPQVKLRCKRAMRVENGARLRRRHWKHGRKKVARRRKSIPERMLRIILDKTAGTGWRWPVVGHCEKMGGRRNHGLNRALSCLLGAYLTPLLFVSSPLLALSSPLCFPASDFSLPPSLPPSLPTSAHLTSRVHPGETQASWMMKGCIDFLGKLPSRLPLRISPTMLGARAVPLAICFIIRKHVSCSIPSHRTPNADSTSRPCLPLRPLLPL